MEGKGVCLPNGRPRMLGRSELQPSGMVPRRDGCGSEKRLWKGHRWWQIWGRASVCELWFELRLKGWSAEGCPLPARSCEAGARLTCQCEGPTGAKLPKVTLGWGEALPGVIGGFPQDPSQGGRI